MHRSTLFHALVSIKPAPSIISFHMVVVGGMAVVVFVAVATVVTMVGLQTNRLSNLIPNKVFLVLPSGFGVISAILLGIMSLLTRTSLVLLLLAVMLFDLVQLMILHGTSTPVPLTI